MCRSLFSLVLLAASVTVTVTVTVGCASASQGGALPVAPPPETLSKSATPDAAPGEPADPPDYRLLLRPAGLMARYADLVSECPDENVCVFAHDGSVLLAKHGWSTVYMVDYETPRFAVRGDDPPEGVWQARVEYALRDIMLAQGETKAQVHCELSSELPALLGDATIDEEACSTGARKPEHWRLLSLETTPARYQELVDVIAPSERARLQAAADLAEWERKLAVIGGSPKLGGSNPEVVRGPLEPRAFDRVRRLNAKDLRKCYVEALLVDRSARGEVHIRLRVGPKGTVLTTEIEKDEPGKPELTTCMTNAIRAWPFPASPDGESSDAVYRFRLKPAYVSQ